MNFISLSCNIFLCFVPLCRIFISSAKLCRNFFWYLPSPTPSKIKWSILKSVKYDCPGESSPGKDSDGGDIDGRGDGRGLSRRCESRREGFPSFMLRSRISLLFPLFCSYLVIHGVPVQIRRMPSGCLFLSNIEHFY